MVMISRRELEVSLGWAVENPGLFIKSFVEFIGENSAAEWSHKMDLSQDGFVTFIAFKRA